MGKSLQREGVSYTAAYIFTDSAVDYSYWRFEKVKNSLSENFDEHRERMNSAINSNNEDTLRRKGVERAWEHREFMLESGASRESFTIVREDGEIDIYSRTEFWKSKLAVILNKDIKLPNSEVHHFEPVHQSPGLASNLENMIFAEDKKAHLRLHDGNWKNATSKKYEEAKINLDNDEKELIKQKYEKITLSDNEALLLLIGGSALLNNIIREKSLKSSLSFDGFTNTGAHAAKVYFAKKSANYISDDWIPPNITFANSSFELSDTLFEGIEIQSAITIIKLFNTMKAVSINHRLEVSIDKDMLKEHALIILKDTSEFGLILVVVEVLNCFIVPEPHFISVSAVRLVLSTGNSIYNLNENKKAEALCQQITFDNIKLKAENSIYPQANQYPHNQ